MVKLTKQQINRLIREELVPSLKEASKWAGPPVPVQIDAPADTRAGVLSNGTRWREDTSRHFCLEKYDEAADREVSICVPIDELRAILKV